MEPTDFIFPAFYVVAMAIGALQSKSLALVIVFAIGLSAVYPDVEKGAFLGLFLIPFLILASFRE